VTLKVADMFTLMPYENSLVVLEMNGPQLKQVLERGYRNYYYYKYVPGYGGYSYYTTCMLDVNAGGKVLYRDANPTLPDGDDVLAFFLPDGTLVDFTDASTYYEVSTVNYLAAGSCNMNDGGQTLWPLDQILHDTQYYVRDAVIGYVSDQGTVSPAIEGRLVFGDTTPPDVSVYDPTVGEVYLHPELMKVEAGSTDDTAVKTEVVRLDGNVIPNGSTVDLHTLALGEHTITATATDFYGNEGTATATFTVTATIPSLRTSVRRMYEEHVITSKAFRDTLLARLNKAQKAVDRGRVDNAIDHLGTFKKVLRQNSGLTITRAGVTFLTTDANWVIADLQVT
jgi:hypothetical protein